MSFLKIKHQQKHDRLLITFPTQMYPSVIEYKCKPNSATIKKYEYGIRNPKPDQLLKIANALGISINLFMDFDIETVSYSHSSYK